MATASEILSIARAELGTKESPAGTNRQKYGEWYNMNGVAWCAIFISWIFRNNLKLIGGKNHYTPTFGKIFFNSDRWGNKPRIGAIGFFNFGNSKYGGRWKGIHHVGIVESIIDNEYVITIEGNTSNSSNANGGMVMRRKRHISNFAGFGYPNYEEELLITNNIPVIETVVKETVYGPLKLTKPLTNNYSVKLVQRKVGAVDDGVFGPITRDKVVSYQIEHKLSVDGIVGPSTANHMGYNYSNETIQKENITKYVIVKTNGGNLNIRQQASASSKILGKISNGTKVVLLSSGSSFSKIKHNNITGFVSNSFIRKV